MFVRVSSRSDTWNAVMQHGHPVYTVTGFSILSID